MSEQQQPKIPGADELDAAAAESTAGGTCDAGDIVELTRSLVEVYDNLVDFTSHVIGRVAGES